MKILLFFIHLSFYFPKINSIGNKFSLLNDNNENIFNPIEFKNLNSHALGELSTFFTSLLNEKSPDLNICRVRAERNIFNMAIDNLLFYSGHDFFDLGNYNLCIESEDYFYALILFKTILNSSSEKYDEQLKAFRSNELSNVGICFWQECENTFRYINSTDINKKFIDYLNETYKLEIKNISFAQKPIKDSSNEQNTNSLKAFKIVYLIIFIYFGLFWFVKIGSLFFNKEIIYEKEERNDSDNNINEIIDEIKEEEEKEKENKYDTNNNSISNDSLFHNNIDQSNIKRLEKYLENNPYGVNYELETIENNSNESSLFKKINTSILFIKENYLNDISLSVMFDNSNNLYNNNDIEILGGIKFLILLFITLNYLIRFNFESPNISDGIINFYKSFYFGFIKLSTFSIHTWIFLDGFIIIIKLINYTKKSNNFITYLKFLSKMIPNILTFLIIFYSIYFFIDELGEIIGENIFYKQYASILNNYECLYNPLMIIIPFMIGFKNYKLSEYDNCYEFSYLLINEFFCILFTILLFYFLNKIKSKIFDICFCIFIFILMICSYFILIIQKEKIDKFYLLKYIMGSNLEIISPLNMFTIFFMGILCGLIYFYYLQNIRDLELFYRKKYYLPFKFLVGVMKFFIKSNKYLKFFIIFFFLFIIFILCFLYTIISKFFLNTNSLLIEFNIFIKLIYVYEVPIYVFSFSILFLYLIFSEDKFQLKIFFSSKFFTLFDRISFIYLCFIQYIIICISTLYQLHTQLWNYLYIWYIIAFQFIFTTFISIFFMMIFTIPFKLILNDFIPKTNKLKI